jgi:pimeloyl-ACP methyl ester carboxylesterase
MKSLETKYCELENIKIAYRECGKGQNIILLHGNSESKSIFKKYQSENTNTFHTMALDSRGHGESISIDEEYSIEQYSDDVIAFCKKMAIKQSYVIGYSDGGNIALFLAKKAPEVFTKIIAISPNYLVNGTTDKSLKLLKNINKIFIVLGKIGFKTQKNQKIFNLMFKDIGLYDNDLRSINTKMEILYAEKDMIKENHILKMGELIPHSVVKKINKCSHMSIIHKKETYEEIYQFFHE